MAYRGMSIVKVLLNSSCNRLTKLAARAAILLFFFSAVVSPSGYKDECFYKNLAAKLSDRQRLSPEDIAHDLCPNGIYAYAWMKENTLYVYDNEEKSDSGRELSEFVNILKATNSKLKVYVTVGAGSFRKGSMEGMMETQESRIKFISTMTIFMLNHGFDGLELNFTDLQSTSIEKQKFLHQEANIKFQEKEKETGRPLLLRTLVAPAEWKKWITGSKYIAYGTLGAVAAVAGAPVVLSAAGFTTAGITAGSIAAKLVSFAAGAKGGVAAGGIIASLQSVGAAGLSFAGSLLTGTVGALGGGAVMNKVHDTIEAWWASEQSFSIQLLTH